MSARTGLLFLGAPAAPEMVSLACRAEAAGFESAWVAETRLTRDAVTPVATVPPDPRSRSSFVKAVLRVGSLGGAIDVMPCPAESTAGEAGAPATATAPEWTLVL